MPSQSEVVADGEKHGGGVDVDGVHRNVDGDRESEITDWKTKGSRKETERQDKLKDGRRKTSEKLRRR